MAQNRRLVLLRFNPLHHQTLLLGHNEDLTENLELAPDLQACLSDTADITLGALECPSTISLIWE